MSDKPFPDQNPSGEAGAAMGLALRRASVIVPYLSGLATLVRIAVDERTKSAGIFPSAGWS